MGSDLKELNKQKFEFCKEHLRSKVKDKLVIL